MKKINKMVQSLNLVFLINSVNLPKIHSMRLRKDGKKLQPLDQDVLSANKQ
jgi:hypothetical protein